MKKPLKIKLGICYNVFDGVELLEKSIKSIRECVDYIVVIYQEISNLGEANSSKYFDYLKLLESRGLINKIILYKPNLNKTPQFNEIKKRNIGLNDCKKEHCNYFLSLDTDEFYIKSQFIKAFKYIVDNNIDVSYCHFYDYILKPIFRTKNVRTSFFVPFIVKIYKNSKLDISSRSFCLVDPTRQISNCKHMNAWVFSQEYISMHHMSFVRKNLDKKFRNSSCNISAERLKDLMMLKDRVINYKFPSNFVFSPSESHEIIKVSDEFNIEEIFRR